MYESEYVLVMSEQENTRPHNNRTIEHVEYKYKTKKGLIQAAHYWARRNQYTGKLWKGGFYSNYVLFMAGKYNRIVMHAYQTNATKDFQSLSVDLTSIVLRKGLGEDVRGDAYKTASSSKVGA